MVETLNDAEVNAAQAFPEVLPGSGSALDFPAASPIPPALPLVEKKPLRFASGEIPAPRAFPAATPRAMPRPRARRGPLSELFDLAVVALMVVCAVACIYRIFWAIQP